MIKKIKIGGLVLALAELDLLVESHLLLGADSWLVRALVLEADGLDEVIGVDKVLEKEKEEEEEANEDENKQKEDRN